MIGRGAQGLPEVIELSFDKLPWRLIIVAVALISRRVYRSCPNEQLGHLTQVVLRGAVRTVRPVVRQ